MQQRQIQVLEGQGRNRDILSAAFTQMVLEVTERMAEEVTRVLEDRTRDLSQALEQMRAQQVSTDRRLRRMEEKVEGLVPAPPSRDAEMSSEGLGRRMEALEASLGKALSTMVPKVEVLLEQLERRPPPEAPVSSSTSVNYSREVTAFSASSPSIASASPLRTPREESPATRRRFVEGLLRVVKEADEAEEDLKKRPPSPVTHRRRLEEELLEAALEGRADDVATLLERGADVNARDLVQGTPLHRASNNGHADVVAALLRGGADVDAKDTLDRTALHFAINDASGRCVCLLLDAGAAVESADRDGWTPLHWASNSGHADVVAALLRGGADVGAKGTLEETALHFAANDASGRCVSIVLDAGAAVDSADTDGWTPLHWAALRGNRRAVLALLTAGADAAVKNSVGETPIDLACNDAILHLLRG